MKTLKSVVRWTALVVVAFALGCCGLPHLAIELMGDNEENE